jgi:hypothetical protein
MAQGCGSIYSGIASLRPFRARTIRFDRDPQGVALGYAMAPFQGLPSERMRLRTMPWGRRGSEPPKAQTGHHEGISWAGLCSLSGTCGRPVPLRWSHRYGLESPCCPSRFHAIVQTKCGPARLATLRVSFRPMSRSREKRCKVYDRVFVIA